MKKLLVNYFLVAVVAAVSAFGIQATLFETVTVPSSSMTPSLYKGERVACFKGFLSRKKIGHVMLVSFETDPSKLYLRRIEKIESDGSIWVKADSPSESQKSQKVVPQNIFATAQFIWMTHRPGETRKWLRRIRNF